MPESRGTREYGHAWLGMPVEAVRAIASCTKGLGLVFSSGGIGVLQRDACCCRASRGLSDGVVRPDSDGGGDPTGELPPDECPCQLQAAKTCVYGTASVPCMHSQSCTTMYARPVMPTTDSCIRQG